MFAPDFLAHTSNCSSLWGIDLDKRCSSVRVHLNLLESSWKHRCLDFTPRVSTLVGLEGGLKCAFSESPDDVHAASLGIEIWEPLKLNFCVSKKILKPQ